MARTEFESPTWARRPPTMSPEAWDRSLKALRLFCEAGEATAWTSPNPETERDGIPYRFRILGVMFEFFLNWSHCEVERVYRFPVPTNSWQIYQIASVVKRMKALGAKIIE